MKEWNESTSTSTTSRVTRSSAAKLNADTAPSDAAPDPTSTAAAPTNTPALSNTRKRKAAADTPNSDSREPRRSKRVKGEDAAPETPQKSLEVRKRGKRTAAADMSSAGPSSATSGDTSPQQAPRDTSKRKSSRRKSKEGSSSSTPASGSRKSKRGSKKDQDVIMKDADEKAVEASAEPAETDAIGVATKVADTSGGADESGDAPRRFTEEELDAMDRSDDPFSAGYLGRFAGHSGLSSSLRALSGIMSGTTTRLKNILEQLRAKDDPTTQMIALGELSELLLVSNEDNLAGHFAPDQFTKELVSLMQPNEFTGEENPEIMLLACRCIANMMEALPASTASVVYGGAVPVLCQKLLEIHFIDLAEQALSTLEKISVEFPTSIVREGGLTACLSYLDFFATSTQRTAVTTAANCCRNIPEEAFPTVRDVMPILLNTLSSSDQRVVEQASISVCRVIDSFKYHESKLDELVSPELLRAILRLLVPGTTNMIGPNIHTQFLRSLSITARASPRLSIELLKMNIVETLYQILTGISPPAGDEDIALKIDKSVIMQAVIRSPREQIFETLNVICELLPAVSRENLTFLDDLYDAGYPGAQRGSMANQSKKAPNEKKLELLADCPSEIRRFAVVLFPTLMHVYTSTVNLSVRQKVLTAQLKMLSNLEANILEAALSGVTYASHLAAILSQQENSTLVTFALQAAELLLTRLEAIYRPQFHREGVITEIKKVADRALHGEDASEDEATAEDKPMPDAQEANEQWDEDVVETGDADVLVPEAVEEQNDGEEEEEDHDRDREDDDDDDDDDDEDQEQSEPASPMNTNRLTGVQDIITLRARRFMEVHGTSGDQEMEQKATRVLDDLRELAGELQNCYSGAQSRGGTALFARLAKHFDGNALESITSYELLTSGIVDVLLKIFSDEDDQAATEARSDFLEVFMTSTNNAKVATGTASSPITPFSVLVLKLQDLLSRSEHFEVITVHHNTYESSRSSAASMLAKQLRLKLVADEDSGIPRHFRNIMVSIHAIATFKALDDYLRPRITAHERPRGNRTRDGLTGAMAAYAAAMARRDRNGPLPPIPPALASSLPTRNASKEEAKGTDATLKPDSAADANSSQLSDGPNSLRRSSRKSAAAPSVDDTNASVPTEPSERAEDAKDPLEVADETQLEDEDDEDDQDAEADLNALVDDLEEGALQSALAETDPSAVNLEIANSGKVTARTEDGDRVSTPTNSQGVPTPTQRERLSLASRLAAARELASTPTAASSRPMSYASALQQPPTDWHIEFSINGQSITSETTIYRACHFNSASRGDESTSRGVWSATHTIKFKRILGPVPADRSSSTSQNENTSSSKSVGLPPSLDQHPITSGILRLMSILHDMNAHLDDVLAEHKNKALIRAEPLAQFVNTKLTAKLNRQLEEPLIVASSCLPGWAEDLTRLYPFLFPFETRHLFLQSTSFGYARSMTRWQNSASEQESRRRPDDRPFLGRLQRQKVRISRNRILESAVKVMELYGSSQSILEVEYFEEVGTGLGPTLEFYSSVSKELSKKKTKLWRENESFDGDEYAFGKRGLFPAPMNDAMAKNENGQRVLHLFKILGKFVARSMMDSRIVDVSFNPTFFRVGDGTVSGMAPSLGAVATVDQDLAKSLKMLKKYASAKQRIDEDDSLSPVQKTRKMDEIRINDAKIEDLGLDFTLPGYPHIELQADGSNMNVTLDNVGQYIKDVIDYTLGCGVQRQLEAFRAGFSEVFPYSALRAFTPDELVMLFGRSEEDWSLETLMDSIKADHGYNLDSKSVRNLLHTMSELGPQSKRDFLQFVTGSPKLPIGGFKALTPMFTVVCKPSEAPLTSDDYLPSVMTCVNYLKMPDYSSLDVMKQKLGIAIKEGQGAFHLS